MKWWHVAALVAAGLGFLVWSLRGEPPATGSKPAIPVERFDAGGEDEGAGRVRPSLPAVPDRGDEAADPGGTDELGDPVDPPDDLGTDPVAQARAAREYRAATEAYHAGEFAKALATAESALEVMQNRSSLHRVAALSACELGMADAAQRHAEVLDLRRFVQVQVMCQVKGIALVNPYVDREAEEAEAARRGDADAGPVEPAHGAPPAPRAETE